MLPTIDRELVCIVSMGFCFMLLFVANSSMTNMQKTITSSITDDDPSFKVDSYTVTGVVYTVFAVSLWFGPYINYALGSKLTMLFSTFGYMGEIIPFILENEWAIYIGAVIAGLSSGIIWPAQGHYMIENSSPQTTARNVGIFWTVYKNSDLWGNLYIYYKFRGKKYIDRSTRRAVLYFLVAVNILAAVAFTALPKSIGSQKAVDYGPIKTIRKCLSIFTSNKMLWLLATFIHTGLQQSFMSGIYSPSVGFTLAFGDSSKELVALSGILISVGGLIGGFCPIIFAGWIRSHRYARRIIILAGCSAQVFAYLITFVNLPKNANFGNTGQPSIITPSASLAMLGSLLLSFGDSCLNTQIFSIIGDLYRESSAEACALYKFVKAVFVAVNFYCCSHFSLHTQVAILTTTAIIGVCSFFVADRNVSFTTDNTECDSASNKAH